MVPFRGECPASGAGRAVFDKTRELAQGAALVQRVGDDEGVASSCRASRISTA
jgi:hypothetical protein